MSPLSPVLRDCGDNVLAFWCPGCQAPHQVPHGAGPGPRWEFDGDVGAPSFHPSILVRYDHWVPPAVPGCSQPHQQHLVHDVCHSFVVHGLIHFLPDSTHQLAGRIVNLPVWSET